MRHARQIDRVGIAFDHPHPVQAKPRGHACNRGSAPADSSQPGACPPVTICTVPASSSKANSPASHLKGIEAGFGVGVTSHRLARHCENVERILPEFTTSLDLWVVAHETVRKSGRVRAAFDHIIAQMQADSAYFTRGESSIL